MTVLLHISNVLKIFDENLANQRRIIVAYSGGKDSTAMSLMLYDWVTARGLRNIEVLFVNADTLSEIPAMREWTVQFMREIVKKFKNAGVDSDFSITTPEPTETFYWRVLIRGYPAPTYNFRWCVKLLKRKPSARITQSGDHIVLLGHRDEESPSRSSSMKRRLGLCPLSAGRCSSYYLLMDGASKRLYPIRDLSEDEIWKYLISKNTKGEISLDKLFELYGYGVIRARYGCWHCTLIKHQIGHYILGKRYMYFEAARLIIRWLSDHFDLRFKKNKGYSKLGFLLPKARSFILRTFEATELLSGIRLYGLDESKLHGFSLRELLYELEPSEANRIIKSVESPLANDGRVCDVESLRHAISGSDLLHITNYISSRAQQLKPLLSENPGEYIIELIEKVRELILK